MIDYRQVLRDLGSYDSLVIYRHVNSDYDAYGSQLGLKHLLNDNCPGRPVFAVGADDIVNPRLLDPMDEPSDGQTAASLAVVVDASTDYRVEQDSWKQARAVLKLDHHPVTRPFADREYVDTDASSCAQIVLELALEAGWTISERTAELLYAGITTDTVGLTINKVDARLFRDLAALRQIPFDLNRVNREIYDVSPQQYAAETTLRSRVQFAGNFAYLILTRDDLEAFHLDFNTAKDMVQLMGHIRGVDKYAIFVETADGIYSASLRAHAIPISDIAVRYGGGGHPLASGISRLTPDEMRSAIRELEAKQ
jgi:phosphoesterase RecJ-like protein